MSDSEPSGAPVLGKRERDDEVDAPQAEQPMDDSDDDDVGPMPMPEGTAGNGAVKKKRKGELYLCYTMCIH